MINQNFFLTLIAIVICVYDVSAQRHNNPIIGNELIFEEIDGLVAVEAEYFFKQSKNELRQWCRISENELTKVGRDEDEPHNEEAGNNTYLEVLPDTRVTHNDKLIGGENFSNKGGEMALLHYKVKISNPGRYYVWGRAFSTGTEDNGIHVGIDGEWPESGQRMQWCEGKNSWRWESKQRTNENHCGEPFKIYLDIDEPGIHEILFSMREDGFEFDRFLMTTRKDYIPEGIGPNVRIFSGHLPNSNPVVIENVSINSKNGIEISGELRKWHKITLTFDGPETSEQDKYNPFVNYRLNVLFTHSKTRKKYLVPGYFAADGNAAETSAMSGNKWRVHFAPDETGEWEYMVQFRKGRWVAVSDRDLPGESGGFMDKDKGKLNVLETNKSGNDFRARGRLKYVGQHYLKFEETGEYFLKAGVDAPENFLSYKDFDGTFHNDGHKDHLIKSWRPHIKDWKNADPTWQDGKGKGIIGALNYLESEGLNSVSFLTFNTKGDDQNVFPFIDYDTYDRYDISKLAQWEIVFEHAQRLGLFLHFKTQEMENQGLLDNGGVGLQRKVYYRELIARFGHHLALNWNLGEEDGDWVKNHPTPPQFKWQRLSMAAYFEDHDPYKHHRVIHNGNSFDDLLVPNTPYTGPSVQTHFRDFRLVHDDVLKWRKLSDVNGIPWAVACDEPGDAQFSLVPDNYEEAVEVHRNARVNALWGTFLAGGWGIEWYFGYKPEHSDLTCEDFRSRDLFWDQCKIALDFFRENEIPYWDMENMDEMMQNGSDYCFGMKNKVFVIMLKRGGNQKINLNQQEGDYDIFWYDPRQGGNLQKGKIALLKGKGIQEIGLPPSDRNKDWVVLLRRR